MKNKHDDPDNDHNSRQPSSRILAIDCEKILPSAKAAVDRIARGDTRAGELETLRSLKNTIHELESRVQ